MRKHKISPQYSNKTEQITEQKSARNTIKFNHFTLSNLKPPQSRKIYWCKGMTGFGIEVTEKGVKTWVYQYNFDNQTRRMVFGKYPRMPINEAISTYSQLVQLVLHGVDPIEEKRNKAKQESEELTVRQLKERYIAYCIQTEKKSYNDERSAFERDIPESVFKKKISKVKPSDISRITNKILERGSPSSAEHTFKYIRRMFNYAADLGEMKRVDNPCSDIRLNLPSKKRQRHLSPSEIYLFWHNLDKTKISPVLRYLMKFLLVTVARPIEIREMKWSHIDLTSGLWRLPDTKNGRTHRIYLGCLALKVLEEVKQYTGKSELVFGSTGHFETDKKGAEVLRNKIYGKGSLSQALRKNFDKIGVEESFYPYDLRRTSATLVAALFGRKDLASLVLNHTSNTVTDIYDQYAYDRETKMAMNALNRALQIIIDSKDIESIPSFEDLRQIVIEGRKESNAIHQKTCRTVELQASFSSPVSYKLSFDHDMLSDVA